MPYLEQGTLVTGYNLAQDWYSAANVPHSQKPLSIFYCPSDRPGAMWTDQTGYPAARGNYVVCYGNHTFGSDTAFGGTQRGIFGCSAIASAAGNSFTPYQTKLVQITDGSSNTILMAEVIVAKSDNNQNGAGNWPDGDFRGHVWHDATMSNPSHCPNIFMTINPPNSSVPDNGLCGLIPNADPLMPCTKGATTTRVNTARSRHTGGVHALYADATARFTSNGISSTTWQGLGTMAGNEAVSPE